MSMQTSAVPSTREKSIGPRRRRDSRTFRRWATAAVMVVPAALIAVSRVVSPGLLETQSEAVISEVIATPGRGQVAVWISVVAAFTLVPAFLAASKLAMRRRPVLSTVAMVVNAIAYLGSGILFTALGPMFLVAADQPIGQIDVIAAYIDAVQESSWGAISAVSFIAGHLIGGVLLGLALRGTVATWAWIAMTVSMPAHLVVYVLLQNLVLDAFAWGLAAMAFAATAHVLVRTPDDEWELPPR